MTELAFLESTLDENAHGTAIIHGWLDLAQPSRLVEGIPTTNLSGQDFGAHARHAFGHNVIVACEQPTQLFIASRAAIQTPNGPLALLGC